MVALLDGMSVPSNPPTGWRPSVQFDALLGEGEATTRGLMDQPNFDEFLIEAGYDPAIYEVVGNTVKTSKWQQREGGDWLTSFRFTFRLRNSITDYPIFYANAKKTKRVISKRVPGDRALVILWSDLQVGKVDVLGGTEALIARCELMRERLLATVKKENITHVLFADLGDTVENFGNAANLQQLRQNDLSIMEQVDVALDQAWDTLKALARVVPKISYASVGSNHCQFRVQKQAVGRPGVDDWGIHIAKQVQRLSREVGFDWGFFMPEPENESVTIDVLGHRVALVHGHQASKPDSVVAWWRGQQFGNQPAAHADILCSGHFHHLRLQECGATPEGKSRFWIQAATLDNGSGWFRRNSGESAEPGLVCFVLERDVAFAGTVYKL